MLLCGGPSGSAKGRVRSRARGSAWSPGAPGVAGRSCVCGSACVVPGRRFITSASFSKGSVPPGVVRTLLKGKGNLQAWFTPEGGVCCQVAVFS